MSVILLLVLSSDHECKWNLGLAAAIFIKQMWRDSLGFWKLCEMNTVCFYMQIMFCVHTQSNPFPGSPTQMDYVEKKQFVKVDRMWKKPEFSLNSSGNSHKSLCYQQFRSCHLPVIWTN